LGIDVRHAPEHAQARALFRTGYPLSLPQLNAASAIVLGLDLHKP
jgi:hypothetical protein